MYDELVSRIKRFGWCKTTKTQLDALIQQLKKQHESAKFRGFNMGYEKAKTDITFAEEVKMLGELIKAIRKEEHQLIKKKLEKISQQQWSIAKNQPGIQNGINRLSSAIQKELEKG
jgi:succinate dehydrogenase/fumarate reductase flavoprotein subunit